MDSRVELESSFVFSLKEVSDWKRPHRKLVEDCCCRYDADWCAHRCFCCCQHHVFVSNVSLCSDFCCVCVCVSVCVCVCVCVCAYAVCVGWSPGVAEEVRPLACSHRVRAALLWDGWRRLAPSTFAMANSKYREQVSEKKALQVSGGKTVFV